MTSRDHFELDAMVADLGVLVECESPSRDIDRLSQHAQLVSDLMMRLLILQLDLTFTGKVAQTHVF
jgi:hypothetical protein